MTQREEFEVWHCVTQASSLKRDVDGEYVNAFTNARWEAWQAAKQARPERAPLTDAEIEKLREKTFSTNKPFCPVDSKSMRKAVRAAEAAHGIKQGGQHD